MIFILGKWPGDPGVSQWIVFMITSTVSTALVAYQAYLSVRLLKSDVRALSKLVWVFLSEIILVFDDFWLTWIVNPVWLPKDALWFWGIALFPLDPQVLFGYAFIGLFAALTMSVLARRSLLALRQVKGN